MVKIILLSTNYQNLYLKLLLSFKVILSNFGLKRQVLILVMVIHINRWSFGILLWETFTLGGTPYPGLPTEQLLDYLSDGKRMDMPAKCPLEVYTIMRDCWIHEPEQRPHFTTLTERLAQLLEKHTTTVCINIPIDLTTSRLLRLLPTLHPHWSSSGGILSCFIR